MALEGYDNPILFMFRAKNYYGMQDKQEITVNGNKPLNEIPLSEIEKRIPKNLPVDVEYKEE
jgi:hypothetical protein